MKLRCPYFMASSRKSFQQLNLNKNISNESMTLAHSTGTVVTIDSHRLLNELINEDHQEIHLNQSKKVQDQSREFHLVSQNPIGTFWPDVHFICETVCKRIKKIHNIIYPRCRIGPNTLVHVLNGCTMNAG